MKYINIFSTLIVACLGFPCLSQASPLSGSCANYRAMYHSSVTINYVEISSLPSQYNCLYLQLSDSSSSYHMCPSATSNFNMIFQMVNNAVLIQNKVNICTDDNYFVGIEYNGG